KVADDHRQISMLGDYPASRESWQRTAIWHGLFPSGRGDGSRGGEPCGIRPPHIEPKREPRRTVKRGVFTLSSSEAVPLFGIPPLSMPPLDDGHSARPKQAERPVAKVTDRDLVDRAKSGDAQAFGQLVRRHQQRIHRLAVHMLRDRAEAEDVTQETFIR